MKTIVLFIMCIVLLAFSSTAFARGELYPSKDYVEVKKVWVTNPHIHEIGNAIQRIHGIAHARVHAPDIKKGQIDIYYEITIKAFWVSREDGTKYSGIRKGKKRINIEIINGRGEGSVDFSLAVRSDIGRCYGVSDSDRESGCGHNFKLSKHVRVEKWK